MLLQMILFHSFVWLSSIPIYLYTYISIYISHLYPFICWWTYLGCFHVLAIMNSAAMNIGMHVSFWIIVLSKYMPRSGIAGLGITLKFEHWVNYIGVTYLSKIHISGPTLEILIQYVCWVRCRNLVKPGVRTSVCGQLLTCTCNAWWVELSIWSWPDRGENLSFAPYWLGSLG